VRTFESINFEARIAGLEPKVYAAKSGSFRHAPIVDVDCDILPTEVHPTISQAVRLEDEGAAVPELSRATRRPACAACGTAKRHYFDKVAPIITLLLIAHGLGEARLLVASAHRAAAAAPGGDVENA
jgi:hypothetical protein